MVSSDPDYKPSAFLGFCSMALHTVMDEVFGLTKSSGHELYGNGGQGSYRSPATVVLPLFFLA